MTAESQNTITRFTREWLQCSTCNTTERTVHWVSDDSRFVVMKHQGHTTYVDRVVGSARCGTYYALYDITLPWPHPLEGPCLWVVRGRWQKSHWTELYRRVAEAQAATRPTVKTSP